MSPPTATSTETRTNDDYKPSTKAPLEPGISAKRAETQQIKFPSAPRFEDKHEEREYLKGRLAGRLSLGIKSSLSCCLQITSDDLFCGPCITLLECCWKTDRSIAAFRIFGKYGFDEGVAGHITVRDPVEPSTFWVNPFGVAFSLIKRSDLIRVNHQGEIIDGGPVRLLNTAAFLIHGAVHDARRDVTCAVSKSERFLSVNSILGLRKRPSSHTSSPNRQSRAILILHSLVGT